MSSGAASSGRCRGVLCSPRRPPEGFTLYFLREARRADLAAFSPPNRTFLRVTAPDVRPLPAEAGTMASADSSSLSPTFRPGLPLAGHGWRSPRVRTPTVPPAPVASTALPLGSRGFVVLGPLTASKTASYALRVPPVVRLASGFLQTPPRGDALAFGSQKDCLPWRGLSPPSHAHAGRTKSRGGTEFRPWVFL